jgi:hypothetical protein
MSAGPENLLEETLMDKPTVAYRNRLRKDLFPPAPSVYGEIRRPNRKGWGLVVAGPPCHKSESGKSFFANIHTGACKCFGCGFSGDLISYVMKRDGLSFRDAAKSPGALDDGLQLDAIVIHQIETERKRREQERQAARELEQRYFEAEDWLYAIESIYRDYSAELSEIRSGRMPSDQEEVYWHVLALAQDELREAETEFIRLRCSWAGAPFNEKARDYRQKAVLV